MFFKKVFLCLKKGLSLIMKYEVCRANYEMHRANYEMYYRVNYEMYKNRKPLDSLLNQGAS